MSTTTPCDDDPRTDESLDAFAVSEEERIELALDRANIPPLYREATWNNFELKMPPAKKSDVERRAWHRLGTLREWSGGPKEALVFLTGPPGCGKTHLAVATLQRWVRARKRGALFRVTGEFLHAMKAGFKTGTSEAEMRQAQHAALLALDDMGSEMATDWVRDSLYMLINYRLNQMKPTIVTSNLSPSQIAETYHQRLASRLVSGLVVDMSLLKDYRLRKGE